MELLYLYVTVTYLIAAGMFTISVISNSIDELDLLLLFAPVTIPFILGMLLAADPEDEDF